MAAHLPIEVNGVCVVGTNGFQLVYILSALKRPLW
jgi:hypothetical protein